jgi:outer membrane lipoprotein-sorting protein
MRHLRTLSTRYLVVLVVVVIAVAVGGAAIAVAASRGGGPTPPPKPLAQALHDSLAAPEVDGITARVKFTNHLFPSGSIVGANISALMSGASGRLWLTKDGRGRLELQSDAGDAQVMWDKDTLTVYDASANTVYKLALPSTSSSQSSTDSGQAPSIDEINSFLTKLGDHADVSAVLPTNVAGQPAYSVEVAPKHDGGLLGHLELAWDAARGVPLRVGVYAQGSSSPVLELSATDVSYGSVPASDVTITPPAGVKTVDLSAPSDNGKPDSSSTQPDFNVVAPDTLVGLPRQDTRPLGHGAQLVVYGKDLGAIAVIERKADPGPQGNSMLSALPPISLDGLKGHELATQLGTAIEWTRDGVSFVLVGSLPPAAAESAARALK